MLTYIETNTINRTQAKTLIVPKDWEMYSSAGNKKITNIAQKLFNSLEADESYKNYVKQVTSFVKAYTKLSSFKTYSEASDTMVRELVYDFLEKVEQCLGYNTLQDIWRNR